MEAIALTRFIATDKKDPEDYFITRNGRYAVLPHGQLLGTIPALPSNALQPLSEERARAVVNMLVEFSVSRGGRREAGGALREPQQLVEEPAG